MLRRCLVGFAWVTLFIGILHAQVPATIAYQGRLLTGTNLYTGPASLKFNLYTSDTAVVQMYQSTAQVAVVDGLYATQIGAFETYGTLPDALTNAQVYLEVVVNGIPLTPRERILSVAYAVLAGGVTNGGVSTAMLGTGAVTGPKLAGGSIANVHLAAGAVAGSNIAAGTISAANVASNTFWQLGGNSGTGSNQFLGTTDLQPMELRVNNQRAILLTSSSGAVSLTVGGTQNVIAATAQASSVLGGDGNVIAEGSALAVITGGRMNVIGTNSGLAVIGGGQSNRILIADTSVIAGGKNNVISNTAGASFIGGGDRNSIAEQAWISVVAGGVGNNIGATSRYSVISGGDNNVIQSGADHAAVAGGYFNSIQSNSPFSTIGGGFNNSIGLNAYESGIDGGFGNKILSGAYTATIGGGDGNTIGLNARRAVIGGGYHNLMEPDAYSSTIAGGYQNVVASNAQNAAIGGGNGNRIETNSGNSAIGGGFANIVQGNYSVVPGGRYNKVAGDCSLAAGLRAQAIHSGTFVWADALDADFSSSANNQFLVRATGGFGINVTNPASALDVGGRLRVRQDAVNAAGIWLAQTNLVNDRALMGMNGDGYVGFYGNMGGGWGFLVNVTNGNIGVGGAVPSTSNRITVAGGAYCSGTTWVNASDKNLKDGFATVDVQTILEKVASLPLSSWHYTSEGASATHLGPTAQDFRAAFGLGYNDTSIATVDADGVALASIQALHAALKQQTTAVAQLTTENQSLKQQLDDVLARLRTLENR